MKKIIFLLFICMNYLQAQEISPEAISTASTLLQNDNVFFKDGKVGIGTKKPKSELEIVGKNTDVDGNISSSLLSLHNNNYSRFSTTAYSSVSYRNAQVVGIRARGRKGYASSVLAGDRVFGMYGLVYENRGLYGSPIAAIEYYVGKTAKSGEIIFGTLPSGNQVREERMRIDEQGNIGIATATPKAKLHLAEGDIYIENVNSGVIMTSPDGKCWRMTVNNNGQPIFEAVSCPD